MYWQEDSVDKPYELSDDVIDLSFRLSSAAIPLDHAYLLSQALCERLPWLADEPVAGIHLIHGASSGHGWQRPDDPSSERLHISHRTQLTLRLPKVRLEEVEAMSGEQLQLGDVALTLGRTSQKSLSKLTTIFSRYVIADPAQSEEQFLQWAVAELRSMDIRVRKMLSGLCNRFETPAGPLFTRSLMLADLEIEESVRLQKQGLGEGRKLGCGLFIPHKGIDAVNKSQQMK